MSFEFQAPDVISDGVYDAKLLSIEKREPGENSTTQKPYLRWNFEVYADDQGSVELIKNTSLNFGQKSNARKYVQSMLGRPVRPGEKVRITDHLPLDCQVAVEIDHESGYNRITNVMGARKRGNGKEDGGAL